MFALLSPKLWIAAALAAVLAFSHFTVYRAGKNNVRTEWDLAKATANEDARRLESKRQSIVDAAATAAAKRQGALLADSRHAAASVDGLRDAIESTERAAQESIATANKRAHTLGELLDTCSREYQALGAKADRHVNDVQTLMEAWPK